MTIIGSQYDPEKAMRSRAYAYECWYNVHYEDNTIGVTDEQLKDFDEKWDVWYSVWTKDAEVDRNEYVISDEDWDLAELEGEEEDTKKNPFI